MSALAAELTAIDLGDRRLNRRAGQLLETLGEKPTLSIPGACNGWDETRAAYRLFDQETVTAEAVLAPHTACTDSSSPIKFRQKKPNAMKTNGIQEMSEAQCLATEAAA